MGKKHLYLTLLAMFVMTLSAYADEVYTVQDGLKFRLYAPNETEPYYHAEFYDVEEYPTDGRPVTVTLPEYVVYDGIYHDVTHLNPAPFNRDYNRVSGLVTNSLVYPDDIAAVSSSLSFLDLSRHYGGDPYELVITSDNVVFSEHSDFRHLYVFDAAANIVLPGGSSCSTVSGAVSSLTLDMIGQVPDMTDCPYLSSVIVPSNHNEEELYPIEILRKLPIFEDKQQTITIHVPVGYADIYQQAYETYISESGDYTKCEFIDDVIGRSIDYDIVEDDIAYKIKIDEDGHTYAEVLGSSNLTSNYLYIPKVVTYQFEAIPVEAIAPCAFMGWNQFIDISLPESLKRVGDCSFADCSMEYSEEAEYNPYNLPNSIEYIGNYAFSGCPVKNIPENAIWIGDYAFSSSLSNYNPWPYFPLLGEKLEHIGNWAFSFNRLVTSWVLPSSLKEIGHHAFYVDLTFHKNYIHFKGGNLKAIRNFVLSGPIRKIVIPDGVTFVGTFAAVSTTKIELGKDVEVIAPFAFYRTKEYICHAITPPRCWENSFVSDEKDESDVDWPDLTVHVPAESGDAYRNHAVWGKFGTILADIREDIEMTDGLFTFCIDTENQTAAIKKCNFDGNYNEITLPSSTTYQGVVYPVTKIKSWSLDVQPFVRPAKYTIPASITEIEDFGLIYLGSVSTIVCEEIVCEGNEPPQVSNESLLWPWIPASISGKDIKVFVPEGAVDAYKADPVWKYFDILVYNDTGSLTNVATDSIDEVAPITVFNLDGRIVYTGLKKDMNLYKGIYIIRQNDKTVKFIQR